MMKELPPDITMRATLKLLGWTEEIEETGTMEWYRPDQSMFRHPNPNIHLWQPPGSRIGQDPRWETTDAYKLALKLEYHDEDPHQT